MRKLNIVVGTLLCSAFIGFLQISLVVEAPAADQITPPLSAKIFDHNASEASPQGRLMIGRGHDYDPIKGDHIALFKELQNSMQKRRLAAWRVVEQMLQPEVLTINGQPIEVPRWHTWYEGAFDRKKSEVFRKLKIYHGDLNSCRKDPTCNDANEIIAERTMNSQKAIKNMVRSLVSENFTQELVQSRVARLQNKEGSSETLGQGFTLFSPSFVKHVLLQSEKVVKCKDELGNFIPADKNPPSNTQFSHCVQEFPRTAVMVKTSWVPIGSSKSVMYHDTTPTDISRVINSAGTGTWNAHKNEHASPSNIYSVETTTGDKFGLNAIHFSTKDVREWLWVSLWWHPNASGDFGADRPSTIKAFNKGVWDNYKMCVTSAFQEGDGRPWESYSKKYPKLAAVLEKTYKVIQKQAASSSNKTITTWCSNPILENHSGNARTNCIGCHQYSNTLNTTTKSATRFLDTYNSADDVQFPQFGRSRKRKNFPAEFAWSFKHEFRGQIACAIDKTKC